MLRQRKLINFPCVDWLGIKPTPLSGKKSPVAEDRLLSNGDCEEKIEEKITENSSSNFPTFPTALYQLSSVILCKREHFISVCPVL